jgi:hypothetical protein
VARYIAMRREPHLAQSYIGDDYWGIDRSSIDVIVSEKEPRRIGLLDQYGNDLYRLPPERRPGFTSKWSSDES